MLRKDLSQEEKDKILNDIENDSDCIEHLSIKDIKVPNLEKFISDHIYVIEPHPNDKKGQKMNFKISP